MKIFLYVDKILIILVFLFNISIVQANKCENLFDSNYNLATLKLLISKKEISKIEFKTIFIAFVKDNPQDYFKLLNSVMSKILDLKTSSAELAILKENFESIVNLMPIGFESFEANIFIKSNANKIVPFLEYLEKINSESSRRIIFKLALHQNIDVAQAGLRKILENFDKYKVLLKLNENLILDYFENLYLFKENKLLFKKILTENENKLAAVWIRLLSRMNSENPRVSIAFLKYNSSESIQALRASPLIDQQLKAICDFFGNKFETEFVNYFNIQPEFSSQQGVFLSKVLLYFYKNQNQYNKENALRLVESITLYLDKNNQNVPNNFYIGLNLKILLRTLKLDNIVNTEKIDKAILVNFTKSNFLELFKIKILNQFKGLEGELIEILFDFSKQNYEASPLITEKLNKYSILLIKKIDFLLNQKAGFVLSDLYIKIMSQVEMEIQKNIDFYKDQEFDKYWNFVMKIEKQINS